MKRKAARESGGEEMVKGRKAAWERELETEEYRSSRAGKLGGREKGRWAGEALPIVSISISPFHTRLGFCKYLDPPSIRKSSQQQNWMPPQAPPGGKNDTMAS